MGMRLGNTLSLTIFGESHATGVGVMVEGLQPGIPIDIDSIEQDLERRKPGRKGLSQRNESDSVKFLSGVHEGFSTGWPLVMFSENSDVRSSDYDFLPDHPRPGHADLVEQFRTGGRADPRGGGSHSGRLTWGLVAAGSIVRPILDSISCSVFSHMAALGDDETDDLSLHLSSSMTENMTRLNCMDQVAADRFAQKIENLRREKDSIGSRVDVLVRGLSMGFGDPWFEGIESVLSKGLFGIPAVRAVEFGHGIEASKMRGSVHNSVWTTGDDGNPTQIEGGDGAIGGLSTGSDIRIRVHFKPPSSIPTTQETLHLPSGEMRPLSVGGRHDPVLAPRAAPVVEGVVRFLLAEQILTRTRPF
jgi:chorismate synthase